MSVDALITCVSELERLEIQALGAGDALSGEWDAGAAAALGKPAPRQVYLLRFTVLLFRYLEEACDLRPLARNPLEVLKPAVARLLLVDPGLLYEPEGSVRQLLELVVNSVQGYDEGAGGRARALVDEISKGVEVVGDAADASAEVFQQCKAKLAGIIRRYNRNALIFEKHIIEKEKGELLREDARLFVNREILQAVAGHLLPRLLLEFLREVWSKYLYITYLREGMDSQAWRDGIDDIRVLVWSLTVRDAAALFSAYGGEVGRTMKRMRERAATVNIVGDLPERFFCMADSLQLQIMDGARPQVPDPVRVGGFVDPASSVSSELLDDEAGRLVDGMRNGRWYWVEQGGLRLRCKLIEKNPARGYVLFTNYSGLKNAKLDFAQLAGALRSGAVRPMDCSGVVEQGLAYALEHLNAVIPEVRERAEEAQAACRAAETARAEARAQSERLRRQEAQRIEQERLRQIQALEEEERRQAEARAREAAEQEARAQALQGILADVERMQPGAVLEMLDDGHKSISCKLGLKLKSSGKMIFVDRFGAKVAEFLPAQLARSVRDGNAVIRNFGVAFDDTLQSLIIDRSDKLHIE